MILVILGWRPQPMRAVRLSLPRGHVFVVNCVRTDGSGQGRRLLHVLAAGVLTKEVFSKINVFKNVLFVCQIKCFSWNVLAGPLCR
jgi:hypothetical protein